MSSPRSRRRRRRWQWWLGSLGALLVAAVIGGILWLPGPVLSGPSSIIRDGLFYTNIVRAEVPQSIHIARVPRQGAGLKFITPHARGTVAGLATLSELVADLPPERGEPLVAINGDYFEMKGPYAGDPGETQIIDGELVSAPGGGGVVWFDTNGAPHLGELEHRFLFEWTNKVKLGFDLNRSRGPNDAILYTRTFGPRTFTTGGRELILERVGNGPWLPLRANQRYTARVGAIVEQGNTPLGSEVMVLSLAPILTRTLPEIPSGAIVTLDTKLTKDLSGVPMAIGGGPLLVRDGKIWRLPLLQKRDPQSAIGWNETNFFFVVVDGRRRHSAGMTLDELAVLMTELGCTDAMHLDGGGSSALWVAGAIRNKPSGWLERPVANAVIAVRPRADAHKR